MNDKTAIITGATKGLGKALSLVFAENGFDIVGIYRRDRTAADLLKKEFQEKNLSGIFIKLDITDEGSSWAEFEEIIKNKRGQKFTFIANASASFQPKPLHRIDWREAAYLIDVNVKGTFLLFQKLLPMMIQAREGTVIGISSAALDPAANSKGFGAYKIAKYGLQGFLKAVSAEYAERGIRVFSVSPGYMETSLTAGWSDHLKTLLRPATGGTDPEVAAAKIFKLAADPKIAGRAENYNLDGAELGMVSSG